MTEFVAGGWALVLLGGVSTRYLARVRGDGREAGWAWRITFFWMLTLIGCVGLVALAFSGLIFLAFPAVAAVLVIPFLIPISIGAGACSLWLHLNRPDEPANANSGAGLTPSEGPKSYKGSL